MVLVAHPGTYANPQAYLCFGGTAGGRSSRVWNGRIYGEAFTRVTDHTSKHGYHPQYNKVEISDEHKHLGKKHMLN